MDFYIAIFGCICLLWIIMIAGGGGNGPRHGY